MLKININLYFGKSWCAFSIHSYNHSLLNHQTEAHSSLTLVSVDPLLPTCWRGLCPKVEMRHRIQSIWGSRRCLCQIFSWSDSHQVQTHNNQFYWARAQFIMKLFDHLHGYQRSEKHQSDWNPVAAPNRFCLFPECLCFATRWRSPCFHFDFDFGTNSSSQVGDHFDMCFLGIAGPSLVCNYSRVAVACRWAGAGSAWRLVARIHISSSVDCCSSVMAFFQQTAHR